MGQKYPLKSQRINRQADFLRFFQPKFKTRRKIIAIYVAENKLNHFRMAVTFKCKTQSVTRNKTRRIVREEFRRQQKNWKNLDFNVVVFGLDRVLKADHLPQLRKEVSEELSQWPKW